MKTVLDQVSEHYGQSLDEHGEVAAGVGWGTAEKHDIRFSQLLSLLSGEKNIVSINDLGCGYGALIDALDRAGHTFSDFTGYDVSSKMIEAAKARYGDRTGVRFQIGEKIAQVADYSFASGIFNVRFDEDTVSWENYILDTLDNMHEHSARGFAFNLLTAHVDWEAKGLYYASPSVWFDKCMKRYGNRVALLHDTELYEWTMIVRKP